MRTWQYYEIIAILWKHGNMKTSIFSVFKYLFCKHKYIQKNTNYKFKLIKLYLQVVCRKVKNVLSLGTLNTNITGNVKKKEKRT